MPLEIQILSGAGRLAPLGRPGPALDARCRRRSRRRREAAVQAAPQGRRLRAALVNHWRLTATRVAPAAGPGIRPLERDNISPHGLLQRCEALLQLLQRRRCRALGISWRDVAQLVGDYDAKRFDSVGTTNGLAYALAAMHWRGCSMPSLLTSAPMHPPTGLVRWLATFSVFDQVDHGRQLFDLLVLEEERVFRHAWRLIDSMRRMSPLRSAERTVLLPELLLPQFPAKTRNASCLLPTDSMKSTS